MKKLFTTLVLLSFLGSNVAQAKAMAVLPSPVAPQLPIEVRLVQQEIRVHVNNNGGVAAFAIGGVLGALAGAAINNAAAKKAETRVVDLRNALVDYDFNARFEQAMRGVDLSSLSPDPQLQFLTTSAAADWTAGTLQPVERVLVLTPDYSVTNDFETLSVAINVALVERKLNHKGRLKEKYVGYFSNYNWTFRLPAVRGSGAEEDAGRMAALGRERLEAMLDRGIERVVWMFQHDLTAEGRAQRENPPKGRPPTHEFLGERLQGHKLAGVEGQEIMVRAHRANGIRGLQLIDPDAPLPVAVAASAEAGAASADAGVASAEAAADAADVAAPVAAGEPAAVAADAAAGTTDAAVPPTEAAAATAVEAPADTAAPAVDAAAAPAAEAAGDAPVAPAAPAADAAPVAGSAEATEPAKAEATGGGQ